MEDRFQQGRYVNHPCVNGCGHNMKLKDDISEAEKSDTATLECPSCQTGKEYSVGELNSIVNSSYNLE